jgi:transcriptional regulator with XRE-family HTH domain
MTTKTWAQLKKDRLRSADAVAVGYQRARAGYMLAERVRALRISGGLSQGELAERMGTTQSAISRLEAGGTSPSIETLDKVGNALHAKLVVDFQTADKSSVRRKTPPALAPAVRALRRSAAGSFLRARKRTATSRASPRSTGKRAAKKSARRA